MRTLGYILELLGGSPRTAPAEVCLSLGFWPPGIKWEGILPSEASGPRCVGLGSGPHFVIRSCPLGNYCGGGARAFVSVASTSTFSRITCPESHSLSQPLGAHPPLREHGKWTLLSLEQTRPGASFYLL